VSANPPVPISRKSCPVKRTFEKLTVTSADVLSAFALTVVILAVNLTKAFSLPVSSSDTKETL
jgi:hypothetical protein